MPWIDHLLFIPFGGHCIRRRRLIIGTNRFCRLAYYRCRACYPGRRKTGKRGKTMNSERYILCIKKDSTTFYFYRHYIDRYRCIDGLSRFYREYGGRLTASDALTFDSKSEAIAYIERNNLESGYPVKYDGCNNCAILEA